MSTDSINDVEAFYRYLGEQLHLGAPSQSPEELLDDWRHRREYDETLAAVRAGMADAEAGRMRPLRELLDEAGG
jgi:hypothetical protein